MIRFEDWLRRQSIPEHTNTLRLSHQNLRDLEGLARFRELEFLDCAHNALTGLPDLGRNPKLRILNIAHNHIQDLGRLPHGLSSLDCSLNDLIRLPEGLSNLRQLYCAGNRLTQLPDLSRWPIRVLDARNNRLSKIPSLPGWITTALFEGNPIVEDESGDDDPS
ncbi:MAG: leucine-rich repeat domain-containing protein [Acidobacteria bacterium]|nr:leucine-rich repeat domain-containing protein [Acidobacteriota bacterium]